MKHLIKQIFLLTTNFLLAISFLSFSAVSLAQEKEQAMQQVPKQNNKDISGVSEEQQNAVNSLALQGGGKISVSWDKTNGTPTFFTGSIPSEKIISKSNGAMQSTALKFLEGNKVVFKLNAPGEELSLLQQQDDNLGMSHLKFNQVYKNIPVWASQIAVHFNKEGMIQSINGRYNPSFEISTTPSISKESAISAAESNAKYKSEDATAELYIYPKDGMFLLAWRVKLPSFAFPNMDIFIDAMNGNILRKDDGIRYQEKVQTQSEKKNVSTENLPAKVEQVQLTIGGENIIVNKSPNILSKKTNPRLSTQNSLTNAQNWQTIISDGFEQTFPGTSWYRKSSGSNTVYWDTTNYKAHTGSKSLYCARSGSYGVDPRRDTSYPYNTNTVLRYGPFSLADADNAILTFSHWTITESPSTFDYFFAGAGTDTVTFYGTTYSGNLTTSTKADVNGWRDDTLYLFDMFGPEAKVWVSFIFKSDASISKRGTFLDDIEIKKLTIPSGVAALGSGIGLDGTTRQLNTARCGTDYNLIDASRHMYVPPLSSSQGIIATFDAQSEISTDYGRSILVQDPNSDNNFNDNVRLRAAVDAHYYTGVVYEYYYNRLNRNSWNNKGGSLKSYVHVGDKYSNAFWNGLFMTYGDGDGITFSNLAGGLDVIGHEITHGVIESTANLIYQNQSGALNESYADCFGTFIEFYSKGSAGNWLIGEDVYTPGIPGDALRDMQDPHNGANWQPAHMSEYIDLLGDQDGGGVHINSGIPNRICYLIASTITRQKTELIYYRALTTYLTSTAQFIDARNATLQAASDLYGGSSAEYTAVESAFTAAGVTSDAARELIYDAGSTASGSSYSSLGAMYAVRMTPPVTPARISKLEYYIAGTSSGTRKFKVHILKDLTGASASELISPFYVTPGGDGWYSVNLSNYISSYHTIVNSDFYVALEYDGTNSPYLGYDDTSNGRGWSKSSSAASWTSRTRTYYIRAVVNAVPAAPSANFTATPTSGLNPLPVTFANQSSGLILNYLWDFGDGYTSTLKNPVHTFTVNGTYNVKLTVIGPGGVTENLKTNFVQVGSTGVELKGNDLPKSFSLGQNYPNPFNPLTNISFSLPSKSFVSLKIFDLMGREVTTIVLEELSAGNYSGQWNAANMSSGIYFYRLQARQTSGQGTFTETKKLLLLK